MGNLAATLKAEVTRLARKEVRLETQSVRKATAGYRHELAALKRRVSVLEQQLKRVSAGRRAPEPTESGTQLRFSATRLAAQRSKLGLSAARFAQLLGVSALSVYKWESGQTRPRQAQLEAIASIRKLGKREAQRRLAQLDAA
jgi:DNA-binding transcriptional regulator YiaG